MASHKYGEINYEINFTPNTQSLQALKTELQQIQNITATQYQQSNPNVSKNLKEASVELINIKKEAAQVENALNKAFNVKLGTANLEKFDKELKGLSLKQIHEDFSKLGPAGDSAFRKLATNILTTNSQLRQSHKLLDSMAQSFKNTVKWGINSSIFNNLSNSLQKAWTYTKNLDAALNDIRIVSGQSATQMEKFAVQANKAAQALGASTLDYAKASLIYFQQGLGTDEANSRAEVTVKMANVLGASAKEVSDYMTAIWNNFDDGSKSLEYFADVITALGASTASSSEEIATGLEKFAAVANTVGLSYEYATAALATVVAQTRQSADTVGTAFKTIFARIQDLELGKTLDDGTTLGKYSEALQKVGINIKDQQNQLKDMNTILDEMGKKWDTLSKDQQVALAQNVAGTRQYTQLIALMDNWDDVTKNITIAGNATGTLQKQQDIYLESTEAHLEKLNAVSERFMASLVDKKGVNSLIDGLADVLSLFANFTESIGGGKNLLLMLGSVGTQVFSTQIASGLATTISNLQTSAREAENFRKELDKLKEAQEDPKNAEDPVMKHVLEARKELAEVQPFMSPAQANEFKDRIKEIEQAANQSADNVAEYWRRLTKAMYMDEDTFKQALDDQGISFEDTDLTGGAYDLEGLEKLDTAQQVIEQVIDATKNDIHSLNEELSNLDSMFIQMATNGDKDAEKLEELKAAINHVKESLADTRANHSTLFKEKDLKNIDNYIIDINKNIDQLYRKAPGSKGKTTQLTDRVYGVNFTEISKAVVNAEKSVDSFSKQTKKAFKEYGDAKTVQNTNKDIEKSAEDVKNAVIEDLQVFKQIGEVRSFVNLASGIGQLATAMNSLANIGNIFHNEDLSTGEKILQITMALGTGLGMLGSSVKLITENWNTMWAAAKKVASAYLVQDAAAKKKVATDTTALAVETAKEAVEEKAAVTSQTLALSEVGEAAAAGTLTAANIPLTSTFIGLAGAIWSALAPLLPFIAAGAALVGVIALIVKAYNSDADAAKQAAEEAKNAAEIADQAKQSYENLVAAFDKYDEGVNALKDLEAGTKEYQEALEEANKAAMDLIKTDNSLAKYATRDGNGLIVFEGKENLIQTAKNRMNSTAGMADIAKINANQKSLRSKRTDFLRNAGLEDWMFNDLDKDLQDEGEKGFTTEGYYGLTDSELQSILQSIISNNQTLTKDDLEKLDFLTEQEIDALWEHRQDLIALAKTTEDLNATNKLLLQESLRQSLEGKEDFAERSEAEKNAIAALYGEGVDESVVNKLRKEAEELWDQDAWMGGGNEDEVHEAYADYMGYTLAHDNSGDTADFINNTTNEELKEVDDDAQRAVLKNKYIQEHLAEYNQKSYDDIINLIDKINSTDLNDKYGADFKTAILEGVASTNKQLGLNSLFAQINPDEYKNLQNMDADQWKKELGLSDEDFKNLGFGSAKEFAENFNKALENYEWSAKDAIKASLNKSTEDFESMDLKTDELSAYTQHVMEVAEKSKDLDDSLKHNSDSALIVAKSVMRMNNGIDKLADGYKDWSEVLKKSSKSSEEYSDALNKMQDALADILDTEDDLISDDFVQKHLKEIEKAANGDAKAIDYLHKELAKQIVLDAAIDFGVPQSEIDKMISDLEKIDIPDVKVGASLDMENLSKDEAHFLETMQNIIKSAGLTADEANALFSQMGFQANFATEEIPTEQVVPEYVTETYDAGSKLDMSGPVPMVYHRTRTRTYQDGTYKATGKMTAIAMETDANGKSTGVPKITGLTKKATGSFNNYSSKNKGGGSPGSSKSGSSSSGSNKKHIDDEFDRYHEINTQISKVESSLKKLQSQQNKFTGAKLIQNLNQQWQLLNTQVNNYNKKLAIANDEQKELHDKLAGQGFKFNADGTIANYMGALQAAEDKYNRKVDQYNKLSSANKKKWDNDETLDKAKAEYDKIKEMADRYDELISNFIPDLEQNIQDSLDKQIELNVQKFNLKLTVTLDMNQATRDWNEWKKRIIDGIDEDDIYGNANARLQDFSTYYSENGLGDIQAQTEQVNSILTELREMDENGWSDIYHDDRAQALEELKEKYTALMESMTDAAQIEKDLYQAILDEMDAVREKFDEQVESYEFLRDIINHDLKVVQMVYGEDAYGAMSKFYDKQQQTYNEQLDFHRQEMDLWYARMEAAEEGSKEWEKARDNWKDAVENYNQTLEAGLENAKNKFQNALNDIFQNLNNQVTNGKGLDFINEEWELVNKNADKYLDTINATYGIRELEKKYLDSINKTDNVKAQQNLKKVMDEQLTNLRQKDKLTQYDLDRANKLYEIEIARMALEDARQNKSQMRLRRDSQGNYSYQYVANQDELQKAQDQVDQLTNSLYNFDKERYNAVLSEVYNIWNEYQQKMAEASLINDPELRAEKQRLIQEQYNQLMMQTEEDYQVSKYNLEESFFNDWTNLNDMSLEDFQNLTDKEKDIIMTELVPTWKNGVSEMADVFSGENGFAKITQNSWKAIKDAEKAYDKDLKKLETTAGQTYESIKNGLDTNISKTKNLIKNNNDLIDTYDKEITKVKSVYSAVGDLIKQYQKAETAAKKAAEEAYKYQNIDAKKQIKEIGDQGKKEPEPEKKQEPKVEKQPEPTPTPEPTPKKGTGDGVASVGDEVTVKSTAKKWGSKSGSVAMWNKVPGNKFYIKAVSGSQAQIGDPHGPNYTDKGITGWANISDLTGYDTGGYTGSWNNSGKLAMLHQKELILNQTDTKNMLNAVSVMRGLTYSLGSSILAKLANASATNYSNTGEGGGILEQDVHIEATFPNVRNAVEIEQALNNLVNVASQRIMEKR